MEHQGRLGGKQGPDRESVLLDNGHSVWTLVLEWAEEWGCRLVPIGLYTVQHEALWARQGDLSRATHAW